MNLYLISQDVNEEFQAMNSAVVSAESVARAILINPSYDDDFSQWAKPEDVKVMRIGTCLDCEKKSRIFCISRNLG